MLAPGRENGETTGFLAIALELYQHSETQFPYFKTISSVNGLNNRHFPASEQHQTAS